MRKKRELRKLDLHKGDFIELNKFEMESIKGGIPTYSVVDRGIATTDYSIETPTPDPWGM